MLKTLKNVKDGVEYILKNYPETRDSDTLLYIEYLTKYNGLKELLGSKYDDYKAYMLRQSTPSLESTGRVRRKFQENNLYLGKEKVKQSRVAEEKVVHQYYSKTSAENKAKREIISFDM